MDAPKELRGSGRRPRQVQDPQEEAAVERRRPVPEADARAAAAEAAAAKKYATGRLFSVVRFHIGMLLQ